MSHGERYLEVLDDLLDHVVVPAGGHLGDVLPSHPARLLAVLHELLGRHKVGRGHLNLVVLQHVINTSSVVPKGLLTNFFKILEGGTAFRNLIQEICPGYTKKKMVTCVSSMLNQI